MQPHQCLRLQSEARTTPITTYGRGVLLFGVGRQFSGPVMMIIMIVVIVMETTKNRKQPTVKKKATTTYGNGRSSDGKQKMSVATKSKAGNPYKTNQRANTTQGERRTMTPRTLAMESEIKAQSRIWTGLAQRRLCTSTPRRPSHLLDHVPTLLPKSPRARPQAETPQMATHPPAGPLPSAAPLQRAFAPRLGTRAPHHS